MSQPQFFTDRQDIGHHINGEVIAPAGARYSEVFNPTTGAAARRVALAEPPK